MLQHFECCYNLGYTNLLAMWTASEMLSSRWSRTAPLLSARDSVEKREKELSAVMIRLRMTGFLNCLFFLRLFFALPVATGSSLFIPSTVRTASRDCTKSSVEPDLDIRSGSDSQGWQADSSQSTQVGATDSVYYRVV